MRIRTALVACAALVIVAVFHAPRLRAQAPAADAIGPAFEVASLRINASRFGGASPLGENHWSFTQANLVILMMNAFGVLPSQIVGVPDWAGAERYVLNAKAEDGVLLTRETLALCLQRFLAERFKLVTHREMQQQKGYALVVAKSGPKMKTAKDDAPPMRPGIGPGFMRAPDIQMDTLAQGLGEQFLHQPVVNETGLPGNYEFTLTFAPEGSTDSSLPSVFTALEEQLGLKLESRTLPVEVLVIDHVEHPVLD